MNFDEALNELEYDNDYIDEVNIIRSKALICIVKNDLNGLKNVWNELLGLYYDYGETPEKGGYCGAIRYFLKKLKEKK